MTCPNCSALVAEDTSFCSKCGRKLVPETIASVSDRLAKIETQVGEYAAEKVVHQDYLETVTAEKVISRIKSWTTLFLYFAGIPWGILLIVLTVWFGRSVSDVQGIATNAKKSVDSIIDKARVESAEAVQTANNALATSKQVDSDVKTTQQVVSKLKDEVRGRIAEVQTLDDQIKASRSQAAALKTAVDSQSEELHRLSDEVKVVKTSKNAADVLNTYPIMSTDHVAGSRAGWIDPKQKAPGKTYITLSLLLTATPNVNSEKVAEAMTSLTENTYEVFLDHVYTYARASTSAQPIGMGLDANSCAYWPVPGVHVPCIIYFRKELKGSALKARDLVKGVQAVPDDHVIFLDPKRLNSQKQELLELSHMDMVVVLGQE